MMHCDLCDKKINPLKDEHHSIPSDEWMIIMCASCYKKFRDDLKRMEDEE